MYIFNNESLVSLFADAKASPRKRAHRNLHASYDEKIQRLFIALIKGSYVQPHYHELPHQWEMFVVINGNIRVCLYNSDGSVNLEFLVGEGQDTQVVEFQPYDIHSVECVSETALMLEIKEGPFDPNNAKVVF